MTLATRLALALDGGGLVLPPEGRICVFHPAVDADLSLLPKDRTTIIHSLITAHDGFAEQGFDTATQVGELVPALSIVCLTRARIEARALLAEAAGVTKGPIVVDGQKTDGADSTLRDLRKRTEVTGPIAKAHGKLYWFQSADLSDWAAGPELTPGGFWTAPGVFSADAVDPASALLAAALPDHLGRIVADLGAGWGFLSAHVLTRPDIETVHLVEAHHLALECARHNVTDPRAQFHWADATTWQPPAKLDAVVMNPPFHTSRAADPSLGRAFIARAARILSPQGQLWMVANRHLPYEETLETHFARITDLGGDARFKLIQASRPKRTRN